MRDHLREAVLPTGNKVFCLGEKDATLVSEQVHLYFHHGINVRPGAVVFDVGANIGLFTLLVHELCHQDADIFSFEPIPAIWEVLSANIQRLSSDRVRAFRCGLGEKPGATLFKYYPHHPTLSTAYGDAENENELNQQLKESILRNLDETPPRLRWLRWLPHPMRRFIIERLTLRSFQDVEELTCEIRTLSDLFREFSVERVDLLKIDTEKSELDVLRGIDEPDWKKIQQVVMEIHDLDGRLETTVRLLKSHGIESVIAEQEPALRGSNVYSLYASREPLQP